MVFTFAIEGTNIKSYYRENNDMYIQEVALFEIWKIYAFTGLVHQVKMGVDQPLTIFFASLLKLGSWSTQVITTCSIESMKATSTNPSWSCYTISLTGVPRRVLLPLQSPPLTAQRQALLPTHAASGDHAPTCSERYVHAKATRCSGYLSQSATQFTYWTITLLIKQKNFVRKLRNYVMLKSQNLIPLLRGDNG